MLHRTVAPINDDPPPTDDTPTTDPWADVLPILLDQDDDGS